MRFFSFTKGEFIMMSKYNITPSCQKLFRQEKDNTCWAATARTLLYFSRREEIPENNFIEITRNFQYGTCSSAYRMCNKPESDVRVQEVLSTKFRLPCYLCVTDFDNAITSLVNNNIPFVLNRSNPRSEIGHSFFALGGKLAYYKQNCYIYETYKSIELFDPSNGTILTYSRNEIVNRVTSILFTVSKNQYTCYSIV
jgi:hypothetical protein